MVVMMTLLVFTAVALFVFYVAWLVCDNRCDPLEKRVAALEAQQRGTPAPK